MFPSSLISAKIGFAFTIFIEFAEATKELVLVTTLSPFLMSKLSNDKKRAFVLELVETANRNSNQLCMCLI